MRNKLIRSYNQVIFDTDKKKVFQPIDDAMANGISTEEIVPEEIVPALGNH